MVVINDFEIPKNCRECKVTRMVLPDKKEVLPHMECLITGKTILDFSNIDETSDEYFNSRHQSCPLENITPEAES